MKKLLIGFLLLFLGLAIGGIGAWFYIQKSGVRSLPSNASIGGQKSEVESKKEEKVLFYRHPMNPSVTSPVPKKDEMGMDFIPVYKEEAEEVAGAVRISPDKIQKIGVKSEGAKIRNLKRTIRTVGRIDHDEAKVFNINTKISGWIEKLYVNKTDQMVHPGAPLLEIYSPDLIATQEEYILAYKALARVKDSPYPEVKKGAESLLQAAKQRLKYWDISDDQIKRLEEDGTITRTMGMAL